MRRGLVYTCGMETITIPVLLLMSLATALATAGGVWFVTQKRVRDLEVRADRHDGKHEQIISEINGLKTEMHGLKTEVNAEISGVKVEIARMQGSIMILSEKFDLFIQGRLVPATPNVAVGGA